MYMELSLFLAKLIGSFAIIEGVVIMVRLKEVQKIIDDYVDNRPLVFLISLIVTVAGLALVLSHNVWETSWVVIITLIGWLVLIKGVAMLLLPHKLLERLTKRFNNRNFYIIGGIATLVIGLYLAFKGFGL